MATTFYFYDLETSGFNPRQARIMQFAGQRTDLHLKPIGEPDNLLVALTDDIVPDPDAILVTGITPQQTLADGLTEAQFLQHFTASVAIPGTIFVGYNTVRFDDEFMRYLHYRNFYDPYEWQWRDNRSRWDLLDVVRMTRALRPDGIVWPNTPDGTPTNRLELLTTANNLDHQNAHDALSDVNATIAVAKLIHDKHPQLFEYLLKMRDKNEIKKLAHTGQPFVYSSGKYASDSQKTTVAVNLGDHPHRQGVLVYDLRHDPTPFIAMTPAQMAEAWKYHPMVPGEPLPPRLPVKVLQYNRCPAVAPLGVLDEAAQANIKLDLATVKKHLAILHANPGFLADVLTALDQLEAERQGHLADEEDVDAQLYDGFFAGGEADKTKMSVVRAASANDLDGISSDVVFKDARLQALLPLYKARNFPRQLTSEERAEWERFRERKLLGGKQSSRLAKYFNRLAELAQSSDLTSDQKYLLEELQLYGQSVMPVADDYTDE